MTCIGAVRLAATATCTSAAKATCAVSASRSAVSDLMKRAGTAIFLVDCDGSRVAFYLTRYAASIPRRAGQSAKRAWQKDTGGEIIGITRYHRQQNAKNTSKTDRK